MRLPIGTGLAQGRSVELTAERLINLFAEKAPQSSKSPVVLHGTPGFAEFGNLGSESIRGMLKTLNNSVLYVVCGSVLYQIENNGASTSIGTILGGGRVGMAYNGTQLCITAGSKGYIYTTDGGLSQITDPDYPGADTVTFIDGFFAFNNRNISQNGQFFVSALNDGTSFNALDFASAERYDDKIVRVFADHSQLLLFGEESIEVWFNSGAADFAFAKAQGSVIEQGLGARWSIEKIDESVVWLDQAGIVRRMNGLTPARISTHAVENAIAKSDWQNATSFSYTDEGHEFYVLTCPASTTAQTGITVVYDAASQIWHERKSYGQDTLRYGFYANLNGKHIVGSTKTGLLSEMSLERYDDGGIPIIAEMQCPPIQADGNRFIVDSLELDVESGVLSSESPKVMLDVLSNRKSDAQQQWRDLGDQGEVNHRVIWRRLGQHRTFTASFKISSPVKRAVMAVYATIRATK